MTDIFSTPEESVPTPVPPALRPEVTAVPAGQGMVATIGPGRKIKKDGTVSKPLGRPPGSRNRQPTDTVERGAPSRISPPRGTIPPTGDDKKEAEKQDKAGRIKEIEERLTGEISEDILAAVLSFTGVPGNFIFVEGHAPVRFSPNPHLTPIGQAFAIPGDVAHYWAKLYIELSYTETGKKLVGSAEGSNLGILFTALMALGSTLRWGQQVSQAMNQLREIAVQLQQAAERQAQDAASAATT